MIFDIICILLITVIITDQLHFFFFFFSSIKCIFTIVFFNFNSMIGAFCIGFYRSRINNAININLKCEKLLWKYDI